MLWRPWVFLLFFPSLPPSPSSPPSPLFLPPLPLPPTLSSSLLSLSALPSLPPSPPSPPPLSPPLPSPVNGSDFLAKIGPPAHLVWNADSTIACVSIPIIDDERVENDEIFYVNMVRIVNSPSGADPRLAPQAIIMIMDDDCKHVYCLPTLCL